MGLVCAGCLEAGLGMGEPFIPLTIAPRKRIRREDARPVIAVSMSDGHALTEEDELLTLEQLVERLRERHPGRPMTNAWKDAEQLPPAIIVTDNSTDLLGYLNAQEALTDCPFWQFKISLREHSAWRPEAKSPDRVFTRECVDLFGFASKRGDQRRAGGRARYYQVIDPQHFSDAARRMMAATGMRALEELRELGRDIRAFCNEHGLRMASTAAGIATQLLRGGEFWPRWRRKVPMADNRRAREHLPGNHYQLIDATELDGPQDAHKLDMSNAHHATAFGCQFPSSDLLRAHGKFKRPPEDGSPYTLGDLGDNRPLSPDRRLMLGQHGMFCLALNVRQKLADDPLALPSLRKAGRHYRYVFSPELPAILAAEREGLLRLEYVHAAWCSPEVDEGLQEYAWWAVKQLQHGGAYRRRWLKGTLLAAYGLLASRPRRHRSAWRWANSDQELVIHTRYGDLFCVERATKRERESPTANVIWRGIIEAALRARMLEEARRMREDGHRVLSIYADGLFTAGDRPASSVLRYEGVRHALRFYGGATHYDSTEEQRLPGIRRDMKADARRHVAAFNERREHGRRRSSLSDRGVLAPGAGSSTDVRPALEAGAR